MLAVRQPIYYLRLTGTPRKIALLNKATNKVTITDLILAEKSITTLTVDITELKL
jgi:hypothetical protein